MRVCTEQTAAQIKLRVNLLCEKCKTLTHSQSRHSAIRVKLLHWLKSAGYTTPLTLLPAETTA